MAMSIHHTDETVKSAQNRLPGNKKRSISEDVREMSVDEDSRTRRKREREQLVRAWRVDMCGLVSVSELARAREEGLTDARPVKSLANRDARHSAPDRHNHQPTELTS